MQFLLIAICILLLSIAYFMSRILDEYREYLITKRKYKLYSLRDELTLLVIKGEVIEGSKEHTCILHSINHALRDTQNITLSTIVNVYKDEGINCENQKLKIENENVARIAWRYYTELLNILHLNSKSQIFCVKILAYVIEFFGNRKSIKIEEPVPIDQRIKALENVESMRDYYGKGFKFA